MDLTFTNFLTTSTSSSTVLHVVNNDRTGTRCGSSASIKADHRTGALMCVKCARWTGDNMLFGTNYEWKRALHTAINKLKPFQGGDRLPADVFRRVGVIFNGSNPTTGQILAEADRLSAGRVSPALFAWALREGHRINS